MEVGKLVTSESCGSIFYFAIDETHPDEPQAGSVRSYYVVAPATSTFSYREAYCVLCRALCGLENRTYLHRWHALYQQIFGTTPYVPFVNAVRESAVAAPNSFAHAGASPPRDRHAPPQVVLPALFLDETTARLALHKAEVWHNARRAAHTTDADVHTQQLHKAADGHRDNHRDGVCNGCSTPLSTRAPPHDVKRPPTTETIECAPAQPHAPRHPSEEGPAADTAMSPNGLKEVKPDRLLREASQWSETVNVLRSEERDTLERLRQELQMERQCRLAAEAEALRHAQALEDAQTRPPARTRSLAAADNVVAAPTAVETRDSEETAALTRRIHELEVQYAEAQARHVQERQRLDAERVALVQQLRQQSEQHGAQIRAFLRDNAGAVKRVEEALEKRERELCAVYTTALEERDVRIAQLSQEVLQHLHNARPSSAGAQRSEDERQRAERVAHLEGMTSQLKEWNAALRRQLDDAGEEIRGLRERLASGHQREEGHLKSLRSPVHGYQSLLPLQCHVCGGLPHAAAVQLATELRQTQQHVAAAKADVAHKADELRRAALVIEQLTRGVREAAIDIRAFQPWRDAVAQQAP